MGALNLEVMSELGFWLWLVTSFALFPLFNPEVFSPIGTGVMNGSLWTIFTFVGFYIIIPVIYYVEKKIGFKKMITLLFVVSTVFFVIRWYLDVVEINGILTSVYNYSVLSYLIFFALGILWSRYWNKVNKSLTIFIVSLLVTFIFKSDVLGLGLQIGILNDFLWMLPYSYAVIWFSFNGFKIFRVFNNLEDLGMGIYIWHMVVINLLMYWNLHEIDWLQNELMYIIVILVTMTLSYISRVFIEKPALKLYQRKLKNGIFQTPLTRCLFSAQIQEVNHHTHSNRPQW